MLCWYFIFGLWFVPYGLIRRGQRKRRMQELRHREMLTRMHQATASTSTALARDAATGRVLRRGEGSVVYLVAVVLISLARSFFLS